MHRPSRSLGVWLAASVVLVAAGCSAPAAEDAATSTDEVVVDEDARAASEALVDEARLLSERRLRGDVCPAGATERAIVDRLRRAVALRDTPYFREQVIGRTAAIGRALADSFPLHEVLGRVRVEGDTTVGLADGLASGVTFYGPGDGTLAHASRVRFEADGAAERTVAGRDGLGNVRWTSEASAWRVDADGRLDVGGARYRVDAADGDYVLVPDDGGARLSAFPAECLAP